jgi:uncharacterized protein YceK
MPALFAFIALLAMVLALSGCSAVESGGGAADKPSTQQGASGDGSGSQGFVMEDSATVDVKIEDE